MRSLKKDRIKIVIDRCMYRCDITPVHEQKRNLRRYPALVLECHSGFVAGCHGFCFLAEEPLYSRELPSLCIGRGPQQLRFVWLPRESPVLGLRAGRISARDSSSGRQGPAITGPNQGSWGALLTRPEAGEALETAKVRGR
jgi:hypothetical protein